MVTPRRTSATATPLAEPKQVDRRSWSLRRGTAATGRSRAGQASRYACPWRRGTGGAPVAASGSSWKPPSLSTSTMPCTSRQFIGSFSCSCRKIRREPAILSSLPRAAHRRRVAQPMQAVPDPSNLPRYVYLRMDDSRDPGTRTGRGERCHGHHPAAGAPARRRRRCRGRSSPPLPTSVLRAVAQRNLRGGDSGHAEPDRTLHESYLAPVRPAAFELQRTPAISTPSRRS